MTTDDATLTDIETVTLTTLADLPSALIDDVCFGMASLPDIFAKYNYSESTAEVFRADPRFKRLIAARTAELDKEGLTHKMRAGMVADRALHALARRIEDPNTGTAMLLDAYKAVAKNAGFEPKGPDLSTTGPAFSVNIIIPTSPAQTISASDASNPPARVIDVTPKYIPVAAHNPAEWEV